MENVIPFPSRERPEIIRTEGGFAVACRGPLIDSAMEAYLAERPWRTGAQAFLFDEWEPGETDDEIVFYGVAA